MDNLQHQKVMNANSVFTSFFLDAKHLYLYRFNNLPSITYLEDVDGEKAFAAFRETYAADIEDIYQYKWYKRRKKNYDFDTVFVIMKSNIIVEFGESYCEIYFDTGFGTIVEEIATMVKPFKERQRRQPLEINLIVQNTRGLDLRSMEIKRMKLNLDLFYEDGF